MSAAAVFFCQRDRCVCEGFIFLSSEIFRDHQQLSRKPVRKHGLRNSYFARAHNTPRCASQLLFPAGQYQPSDFGHASPFGRCPGDARRAALPRPAAGRREAVLMAALRVRRGRGRRGVLGCAPSPSPPPPPGVMRTEVLLGGGGRRRSVPPPTAPPPRCGARVKARPWLVGVAARGALATRPAGSVTSATARTAAPPLQRGGRRRRGARALRLWPRC